MMIGETDLPVLRCVLVGVGANIFEQHRKGIEAINARVVGVNDIRTEVGRQRADEFDWPFYDDYPTMLAETQPDLAIVITPHEFHVPHSIAAMDAGAHVLVEKPIAVHIKEAHTLIAAAKRCNRVLAVNFQQRLRPEIIAARKLIQEGGLGKIQNVDVKMTWTRTATYFASSTWRGTWEHEGGGVLLNQAPHELDLVCHLLGMPARVFAWVRRELHAIETEDTIQAMLEWPDHAIGSIHISTAEAGQPQRFEIIGTGGHLSLGPGKLDIQCFDTDLRDFIRTATDSFAAPGMHPKPVELPDGAGDHVAIYRNLQRALAHGTPLAADAVSSTTGLELANAMLYSSVIGQLVEFPLDPDAYLTLLTEFRSGQRSL